MNNVHRLVVPKRDDIRRPAASDRPMGEVLILPCVRYERIETPCARRTATSIIAHEDLLQDLTA